ncbi:MAG: fasciclin domain-containing protein [Myxococcales bacterium]|nr:fasciclin domain-containing protein [Myxococcales bacterium]
MLTRACAALCAAVFAASPAYATDTITDIVAASGGTFDHNYHDYDVLLTAVIAAELDGALADPAAHLTVFAPNDLAFVLTARDLGYHGWDEAGAWDFLVVALTDIGGGDPIPVLTDILLYHVAGQEIDFIDFLIAAIFDVDVTTLLGETVHPFFFGLADNDPDLRDPRLTWPINVQASNGIIHTINRVLIPVDL